MKSVQFGATMVMVACMGATGIAQDRIQDKIQERQPQEALQNRNAGQNRDQQQQSTSVKQLIVKKLKHANKCEIELAQMAQERVENPELKEFASMLNKDHQAMQQKLEEKWGSDDKADAGQQGQPGVGRADAQVEPAQGTQGRTQSQPGHRGERGGQGATASMVPGELCDIMEQAGQNMQEMTKKMLMEQEGQDFQMAFLGQQISKHTAMIAELKAIQSVTNYPELQPIVDEALQKTEQHFEKAKSLAKKFEKDSGRGSERNVRAPGNVDRN